MAIRKRWSKSGGSTTHNLSREQVVARIVVLALLVNFPNKSGTPGQLSLVMGFRKKIFHPPNN